MFVISALTKRAFTKVAATQPHFQAVSSWGGGILTSHTRLSGERSSSLQLTIKREFGAPKRFKGKGPYIRKKNALRRKGEPRNVREFPPPPPVINALPKEVRIKQNEAMDLEFASELRKRIDRQNESVRFDFEGLVMSDRVKRLFQLTNGSQKEVVRAQKMRGMELFKLRDGDTGSSAVQVVALTTRIQQLQTHLTSHRKDNSTKRGLQALFVRRRKLLDYLENADFVSYRNVVKTLGLAR